jgi:hypothetical protein
MRLFVGSASVSPLTSDETSRPAQAQTAQSRANMFHAVTAFFSRLFTIDPAMYIPPEEVRAAIIQTRQARELMHLARRNLSSESASEGPGSDR